MKKIRMGILGCADIANRLVIPNMILSGNYDVVAFASRDYNKAILFKNKFGGIAVKDYQALIERDDIDAVYIPLPPGLHYEWIIKALNAKKHVFSEKSITTNYNETKNIISLARTEKLVVFENFMFPFHSQFEFVKEKIANGAIGIIKLLRSSFGFPIFNAETNIRYKKKLGGGALFDAGAYTLMAAQLFLGSEQKIIGATLINNGKEVDFQGAVMLRNNAGIVSQLAFGFDNFYQNNIELWGSTGKLTVMRAFTAGPGFMPEIIIEQQNKYEKFILNADNHSIKILNAFYNAICNNNYDIQYKQILNQSNLMTNIKEYAK